MEHLLVVSQLFDSTHIYGAPSPVCPGCPTREELCHSPDFDSSRLVQHLAINLLPSTIGAGIGGHWRCEIDEGVLVKMSAGDQCPERERERERGKRENERESFWGAGAGVTDRGGKSTFS